jgi:uncharacterized protein YggT (Ycf19 family)
MIEFFFGALSFLILARVIFSFIGYNYGGIYDFVYEWSEKILKPIRSKLPANSKTDWSPFIALIAFDFLGTFLHPMIVYAVNWEFDKIAAILIYALLSTASSIAVFMIILLIVRLVNDSVKGQNYSFTAMINSVTELIVSKVRHKLSFAHKQYAVWITLGLLFALQIILQYLMVQF